MLSIITMGFPGGTSGKNSTCQCMRCKSHSFYPWVGKVPWRRKWQPTPMFLPEKAHEQRSLAGYSAKGYKERDTVRSRRSSNLMILAHRFSCFSACGVFPGRGANPCLLHWQADSLPLSHQGSPQQTLLISNKQQVVNTEM